MHFSWGEDPKVLLRDVSAPSLCCILKQQNWNNQQMVLQAEIFYYVVCMCASAVADAVEARKNPIIIDSTFLQQWERDQYIKLVRKLSTLNLHDVCECCWVGFFYLKLTECHDMLPHLAIKPLQLGTNCGYIFTMLIAFVQTCVWIWNFGSLRLLGSW